MLSTPDRAPFESFAAFNFRNCCSTNSARGRGVVLPKQNSSLTRVSQGLSIQRGWWGKKPRDCKKLVRAQTLDASQTGKVRDSWKISRHLVGTQILEVDWLWIDAKTYHWDSKGLLGKISVFTLWGFFLFWIKLKSERTMLCWEEKELGTQNSKRIFFMKPAIFAKNKQTKLCRSSRARRTLSELEMKWCLKSFIKANFQILESFEGGLLARQECVLGSRVNKQASVGPKSEWARTGWWRGVGEKMAVDRIAKHTSVIKWALT